MAEMEHVLLKSNRLNPWKSHPDQLASLVTEENEDDEDDINLMSGNTNPI